MSAGNIGTFSKSSILMKSVNKVPSFLFDVQRNTSVANNQIKLSEQCTHVLGAFNRSMVETLAL